MGISWESAHGLVISLISGDIAPEHLLLSSDLMRNCELWIAKLGVPLWGLPLSWVCWGNSNKSKAL